MSRRSYVLAAAAAIAERPYLVIGTYLIGTIDDWVVFVPQGQEPKSFVLVHKLSADQVNIGLTATQWHTLEKKLIEHFEREPECQNNHKP